MGRELNEIIKPRQGAEKNVGTGGGLGVQALPKGMGPLAACSGAAAMELLALPPRDQHVFDPLRLPFLSARITASVRPPAGSCAYERG